VLLLIFSSALLFAVFRQSSTIRNIYILHESQWLADCISSLIALALAVVLLCDILCKKHIDVIFTIIPLIQSVFLLTLSVDYLIARFLPHFHHTSPFSYRIALVATAYSAIVIVVAVVAVLVYIGDESDESCLPEAALSFWAFSSLYNVCLLLQLISALFHSFLLCGKQFDCRIKTAICIRIAVIFVLFVGPTSAIVLMRILRVIHVDIMSQTVILFVLLHSLCNTTFCVYRSSQLRKALSSSLLICSS
uniref:G-protein coupled receptors family 1 profile domain-containing protein n=1 Tax=Parascaris univalens TaxID=6257 RepID=A0A915BXS0_PARUN